MNSLFQGFLGPLFGAALAGFGAWVHHALYIRPNQLKIKVALPATVKSALQSELNVLVPVLASRAEAEANTLVTGLAQKVLTKV